MFRLGVTGGIGSGKSLVCEILSKFGIPVYDSDLRARELMRSGGSLEEGVIALLGRESYRGGELNRSYIAGRIFTEPGLREGLNSLVHPAVAEDFETWVRGAAEVPYVVKEAAILFESGAWMQVDMSVLVTAPEELRVRRIKERDGVGEEEVRRRMSTQMSETEALERADLQLRNDESSMLLPRVVELHEKILRSI